MNGMNEDRPIITASCSVPDEQAAVLEIALHSDARITLPGGALAELKAGQKIDASLRGELITKIRQGEHHEIMLTAITFRQKDGHPNRNFLRFKSGSLAKIAASFVGMPVLRDHNKWSTQSRLGTIVESEAIEQPGGWIAFRQRLHIVKPDAVISALDGTLDRFSIGWSATGPVLCTVHRGDVRQRNSCLCWPGDRVALDGKEEIVEYEYQSADGIETSSVNVPAVKGTRNEDIRIALAAELGLGHRQPPQGNRHMNWAKLATLLGLATIGESDEDRVLASVGAKLTEAKLWQDRALAAEKALADARVEQERSEGERLTADVDRAIAGAYSAGKLLRTKATDGKDIADPQEAGLRAMGSTRTGFAHLEAFLATMPQKVPLGRTPPLGGGEPPRAEFGAVDPAPYLDSVAKQLGLKPDDVRATYNAGKEGR